MRVRTSSFGNVDIPEERSAEIGDAGGLWILAEGGGFIAAFPPGGWLVAWAGPEDDVITLESE